MIKRSSKERRKWNDKERRKGPMKCEAHTGGLWTKNIQTRGPRCSNYGRFRNEHGRFVCRVHLNTYKFGFVRTS